MPKKLVARVKDAKAHADHLRDFFVIVTTLGSKNKNYRIQTQKDGTSEWTDLLPMEVDDLVITEFDGFKDFIAIYCKRAGVPEICIQDLETKKF